MKFISHIGWGFCAAALLVAGCHKEGAGPGNAAQLPAAKVATAAVAEKTYPATEEVTGTVRSKTRASIEAKVSGRIEKMLVVVGQRVKAGELLLQLDAREIQARLDQAKAVLEQTREDRKRFEKLLKSTSITQQEYDAVVARDRVAEAAVREAETLLGYATVTAPFAGVITRKLAEIGDVAAPGRALLELEDPDALRLESDFPEALIAQVHLGDTLEIRLASATNALNGVVCENSPAADPNSRTFGVKMDLPAGTTARLGQFGRVSVPTGQITTLRVPVSAVVVRGQMEIVFASTSGKAQLRLVKTGKRFGGEVEILAGLRAGETIVTDGAAALVDGQPLEAK
jgi:RND family efflux transporter MFP subunit